MYATLVRVTVADDPDATVELLRSQVVPRIRELPGFHAGYWTRAGNTGVSMVVFDSEEAANVSAGMARSIAPPGVTVEEVEVREVVAHA